MIFTMPADQELTEDRLKKCIEKHATESTKRYAVLKAVPLSRFGDVCLCLHRADFAKGFAQSPFEAGA